MHRLRKGKKGNKEEEDGVPPVPATTTTTSHNLFKWGRTPEPPPKPQIDLENALPPSDDFRTSLLMPNLAQRFSILQMEMAAAAAAAAAAANGKMNGENSIASTGAATGGMEGFNFTNSQSTPLGDITETSSLAESGTTIQQNRLTTKSQESVASDESGGIMNRSRGGEGNILFGGRQKVYRVPNAYMGGKDFADDSNPGSPMSGRAVGSYDLPEAAFTTPKQRREQQDSEEASSPYVCDSNEYNRNRNTSSSTNSAPTTITRSSTAATSVTSNRTQSGSIPTSTSTSSFPVASGPMVANKPRRALYEQALDQQLQDQQSTAVGRIERLASLRKASASPPPANNYQGNFSSPQLGQQPSASPSSPVSPQQPQWSVNIKKSTETPMSTPEEEENEEEVEKQEQKVPRSGLLPHMAQFNFGLEPRSQSPISSPGSASSTQFPTQGPFSPGNRPRDQQQRDQSSEMLNRQPEQKRFPSPLSDTSDQYGHSAVGKGSRGAFSSMRSSTSDSSYEPEYSENDRVDDESKPASRNSLDNIAPLHPRKQPGTSSTDSESEPLEPVSPVSPVSPISPIFSNSRGSGDLIHDHQPLRNPAISPTSPRFSADRHVPSDDDSPTLPPGQGLSMLVRQHLRTDSGHSSVYDGSTYTRTSHYGAGAPKSPKIPEAARPSVSGASGSSGGNLWEFDDWDGGYYVGDDNGPPSPSTINDAAPAPSVPMRASRSEERRDDEELARERGRGRAASRTSERDRALSRASDRERSIPAGEDEHDKDWEQQLAFRRQIIQQNLRNREKVDSQHEMNFPSENFEDQQSKNGGFGVLRSKGSNGILSKNDPPIKPLRNGRDSPGPGMRREGGRSRMNSSETERRFEEERRLRETVRGLKNIPSGNYPMQQHPPHSYHHIPPPHARNHPGQPLNANQQAELRSQQRSPIGLPHPLHSPMHTPRPKQRPSREQMNGGYNTPRGQPMGWRDERDNYGMPRPAPGTQPGSPISQRDGHGLRKQPNIQRVNGPEMHRLNQGQFRDQEPRQGQFRDQDPRQGQFRDQDPRQGQFRDQDPRQSQFRDQDPRQGQFRDQDLRQGQFRDQDLRQGQFRDQDPRQGQFRDQDPRQGQFRDQDPRQGQFRDQDPRQGQFRDQEPRQGRFRDQEPRQGRHGGPPPPGVQMNHGPTSPGAMINGLSKKQSFDRDATPPGSDFRRPRGSSNASSGPTMRQRRGTFDGTPLPPLNTTALAPPMQHLQSATTPKSAATAEKSPAYSQMQHTPTTSSTATTPVSAIASAKTPPAALIQTIANSNAGFAPARKRIIDKSKIGDPKLISSTSNIPTVDLPGQNATPPLSAKDKDGRKRRATETRSIFGGFGKNRSTEEVPSLPAGSPMMPRHHTDDEVERSSFTDDPPPKKKSGKLRKSTSDGGALGARARRQEAMVRSPTIPKISKTMAGGGAPAGMI